MPTPILMPQMGESIAEGTIVRWIKNVGDAIERDEPLFEISTDKVDAEIPSPAAGVLAEIKVKAGETVNVNEVVGTIAQAGEQAAAVEPEPDTDVEDAASAAADGRTPPGANGGEPHAETVDDLRRRKSSPLVRRIARDHDIDIAQIPGSGIGGRVTKTDILGFLDKRDAGTEARRSKTELRRPGTGVRHGTPDESRIPNPESRTAGARIEPMSVMRRKIAEHMVLSRRTSAHVHSVFHVNFSTVEKIRQRRKAEYEQRGAKLTYMAFIAKAVVDALRRHPIVNASIDGDNIVYKTDVNLGIAVALESGLIVPVIKRADERNLLGLSRAIADLAERARAKQLKPEEVQEGTFTITNPGQFGAQFGMPIINQPQVAILGVGTIEKRPIVVDDALAIRTMAYLTLGFDHRLIDGAVADQFMADITQQLEHFDEKDV